MKLGNGAPWVGLGVGGVHGELCERAGRPSVVYAAGGMQSACVHSHILLPQRYSSLQAAWRRAFGSGLDSAMHLSPGNVADTALTGAILRGSSVCVVRGARMASRLLCIRLRCRSAIRAWAQQQT